MELKDIVATRRSIRKFSDKVVEQEVVDSLVATTLKAPSSRNSRSTHLLIISNRETITSISDMRDYGSSFIKGAPLFILVMGDKEATDLWEVNCAISATTMQLAATDLGLSSCWVHVDGRPHRKDEPQGTTAEQFIRNTLEIPESFGILCGIAVGYSDFVPAALPPFDTAAHVKVVK